MEMIRAEFVTQEDCTEDDQDNRLVGKRLVLFGSIDSRRLKFVCQTILTIILMLRFHQLKSPVLPFYFHRFLLKFLDGVYTFCEAHCDTKISMQILF